MEKIHHGLELLGDYCKCERVEVEQSWEKHATTVFVGPEESSLRTKRFEVTTRVWLMGEIRAHLERTGHQARGARRDIPSVLLF